MREVCEKRMEWGMFEDLGVREDVGKSKYLGRNVTPTVGAFALSSTGGIASRPEAMARKKLCADWPPPTMSPNNRSTLRRTAMILTVSWEDEREERKKEGGKEGRKREGGRGK